MSVKKSIYLILTMMVSLNISSCSKAQKKDVFHDELRIDIGYDPSGLDPQLINDASAARIANDLFEGLVSYDQANKVVPGLAESWVISDNGKRYTFFLRHNARFSNGDLIRANDVVMSFQRLVDLDTAAPLSFLAKDIINADSILNNKLAANYLGIKATDPYTVEINLTHANPDFIDYLALPAFSIVPVELIRKERANWTKPTQMISSGAYRLSEYVLNGHVTLQKNPYYYAESMVAIKQVKFIPFGDRASAFNAYQAGQVDITNSMPLDVSPQILNKYANEIHRSNYEALVYYDFNMHLPLLRDNLKLRQALSIAVDRETLINKIVTDEIRRPLYAPVTKSINGGAYADIHYEWESLPRAKQIEYAQKLYVEAGYGVGHPLHLTILYNSDEGNKKRSLALASMWHEVLGVDTKVKSQEWKTFLKSRHHGDYMIARDGSNALYDSVTSYTNLFVCNSQINHSHYCNPEYDKLINLAGKATIAKEKQLYYHQALELVLKDYPIIPLYQPTYSRLVKPYVKNYDVKDNHLDLVQTKWLYLSPE